MGPLVGSGCDAEPPHPFDGLPIRATRVGPPRTGGSREPFVVDLSSLWAGPLCTRLLADAGHRVVKVESTGRPDAARHGDGAFFDLLHAGKRSVALDFADPGGVSALHRLVAAADVVVEASRPRALRQLGIDASACLRAASGPSVWVSITAGGRAGPAANRAGFGDDVAAAAGLVVEDGEGPVFCADAIADPLSGLVAAAATQRAWHDGGRWLLDVAMIDVARAATGPTLPLPAGTPTPAPRPSRARGRARPFGADTPVVLARVAARSRVPAER
jgi:crotonobetainyl-CoA:carnitine CoA-transferase CaiB-like acyl-CoA transferase